MWLSTSAQDETISVVWGHKCPLFPNGPLNRQELHHDNGCEGHSYPWSWSCPSQTHLVGVLWAGVAFVHPFNKYLLLGPASAFPSIHSIHLRAVWGLLQNSDLEMGTQLLPLWWVRKVTTPVFKPQTNSKTRGREIEGRNRIMVFSCRPSIPTHCVLWIFGNMSISERDLSIPIQVYHFLSVTLPFKEEKKLLFLTNAQGT